MKITAFWEIGAILFWKIGAISFWEIGADLKLVQVWKNNKQGLGPNVGPALFGPMAGPQLKLAPLDWACPVSVRTGPVTRARELSMLAPLTGLAR